MAPPSGDRHMRQSTLASWDICGLRAQYSMVPDRPYTTSQAAAIGTGYHRALEVGYGQYLDDKPTRKINLPMMIAEGTAQFLEEVEKAGSRFRWDTDRDQAIALLTKLINAYADSHRMHSITRSCDILGVEVDFDMPWIEGWRARGTVDLVVLHRDTETIHLIDHKTSGKRWPQSKNSFTKLPQAAWYWEAMARHLGEQPSSFVFDVMTYKGELDQRRLNPNPPVQARVLNRFFEVASIMDTLDGAGIEYPANPTAILCSPKYCDHWDDCPFGEASTRPYLEVISGTQ